MKTMLTQSLPPEFAKYFWDCELQSLNMQAHSRFIIERLLNMGNDEVESWLLLNVKRTEIADLVQTGRNLDKKTRNYWKVMLG